MAIMATKTPRMVRPGPDVHAFASGTVSSETSISSCGGGRGLLACGLALTPGLESDS
jgi:hypothetical protein